MFGAIHNVVTTKEEVVMKTTNFTLVIVMGVLLFSSISVAMSFPPESPRITLDGRLSCPYVSTHGGTTYLQISLATSGGVRRDRRPMNVAVVLDRSGSMSDAGKMEYARQALLKLVDQLDRDDIFSLVIYDDVVEVPYPATRVESKTALKRLIEKIYPRGSTNLGAGMMEGFRQAERNLSREYVNRVILLSDGLANQGITDPMELSRIARRYRTRSISLTTMGVGAEYNENLMVGLSEAGGGNYYFIESPYNLASIMGSELNTLSSVVAQNASIELTLGRNVRVRDVIGCEHHAEGDNRYIIPVGDICADESREFTVELLVPEGAGTMTVVRGSLMYESETIKPRVYPSFSLSVHYTPDVAVIRKNTDWGTQAKADVAVSTRDVEKAMKALDEGRRDEAEQVVSEAKELLSNSPAASMSSAGAASISAQISRLESYSNTLKDKQGDARVAKKSIQYNNYKTQRQK